MSTNLTEKVSKSVKYLLSYLPEGKEEETLFEYLEELGITNDDVGHEILMSPFCKEGDARSIFCEKHDIPVPRFRIVWSILKDGSEDEKRSEEPVFGLTREIIEKITPVGQLSDKELLEKYNSTCDSKVDVELKTRSELRPCIIFKDGSKDDIDVDLSLKFLREARRRETPNVYKDKGKVYKIYRVGEFPEQVYIRCPVTGKILFDGYSEELGFTWDMTYESMQFVALMVRSGIKVDAFTAARIQEEYTNSGIDGLRLMFPKISSDFDELKEIDELPNLKANLTAREVKQDPFGSTRY